MPRRWISILALAIVLAITSGEIAPAYKPAAVEGGNLPLFLNGGFKPTRLPKKKPAPVDLVLQGSEFLAGPAALKEAVFEIDRNVALDVRGLATCSPHRLLGPDTVPGACDPAQVGKGELEVEVAFSEQQPFILKSHLVAFNAGVKGGVAKILVKGYLPPPASAVFGTTVEVSRVDHGQYGTRWTIPIPIIAGGSGSVKEFRLGFFRRFTYRRKRRSYLLGLCRDGRLLARGEAIFEGGTDVPGKFARPCTPGS
jgi:hypothetical protein